MNLKEAFQAQNTLENLFERVNEYLLEVDNVTITKEKHFRSKAAEGQIDEEMDVTNYNTKIFDVNKMIDFLVFLIGEREKLAHAIHTAKLKMNFDLDSAVDVNKKRHLAINILRNMRQIKSSSVLRKNGGTDYIFNKEGNQTTFRYDVERITTIDFDRNKVRDLLKKLQEKADAVSNEIDAALINTQVDYIIPFDSHADVAEIFEDFFTSF